MDFSRLHTYTPPCCLPANTGYTYALSSSYSSAALDFENRHKLDPVFDSPRMLRRSLRLGTATHRTSEDTPNEGIFSGSSSYYTGENVMVDQSTKITKQRKSVVKQSGSAKNTPRKDVPSSSIFTHSSFSSHASDGSLMSNLLDESSIQEQTAVNHFWGLDDDADDLKGGDTTLVQANGENQNILSNGYTCNDCSRLSEQKGVFTARAAAHMPSSTIYSRDRSQKYKSRGLLFYSNKILRAAQGTATSITSLIVQLFQMILLKLGYDDKAYSNYCGSMNVNEYLREDRHLVTNGESMCDDCKGKKHLEIYTTAHMQSSRSKRVGRTIWHIFSHTGYLLLHMLQRMGTAGWFVSQKVLSFLWLAVASPGKAAAGMFWWLGTGWYQLVTLISLLNVFLLTRCLGKLFKLLLFLLPLLLLLGFWYWGPGGLVSLLPTLNWSSRTWEETVKVTETQPDSAYDLQQLDETMKFFDAGHVRELEMKMKSEMLVHINNMVDQHIKRMKSEEATHPAHNFLDLHHEHESRIMALEALLAKFSEKSEGLQKELELTKTQTASDMDEQNQHLLSKIKHLELQLAEMKSELLSTQNVKTCCDRIDTLHEKVDAQVKELVTVMLFGSQRQGDFPESLLQWLTSKFVSKSDLHVLLRDLELQILKNITLQMSVMKTKSVSEVVTSVVNEAGISGITEAQAHVIVNNALKLFSQDKTGMVDFALESGGGSILSTRCSETYETKTALVSLFGIPLWYFSQSPRVVIQPDMYPGNCWAFKGSQGYIVIRLSMMIHPTAFTLEHIPKTLSPTGNITSAPKDFSVYGLENEYQEEGVLLGQYMYDQDGESLQMFQIMEKTEEPFQIVELRIFSNWGHTEYTCLYRFRVHGIPAQ